MASWEQKRHLNCLKNRPTIFPGKLCKFTQHMWAMAKGVEAALVPNYMATVERIRNKLPAT